MLGGQNTDRQTGGRGPFAGFCGWEAGSWSWGKSIFLRINWFGVPLSSWGGEEEGEGRWAGRGRVGKWEGCERMGWERGGKGKRKGCGRGRGGGCGRGYVDRGKGEMWNEE